MFATLRRVWILLAGQRLRYGGAIAALVLASCCLYLAPLIPQAVLDGVLAADPGPAGPVTGLVIRLLGGPEALAANLWLPAAVFLAVSALAGAFTYLRGRLAADASESIVRRVRDEVYDHLQHLSCRYFDGAETGDLIQRATSDVETLRTFLASQVVEIGRALIMLLVPLPLMLLIDWHMTVASVLLLPLISGYSFLTFRRIKVAFTAADEAEGALTSRLQENLSGVRIVRAFARDEHEQTLFDARNAAHRDLDHRLYLLLSGFWACSDLLCFAQKGLVLGAGVVWLADGSLPVGAFFYFLTAVNLFLWPVRHMGRILADLGKAVVAIERLDEVLSEPREVDPPTTAPTPAPAPTPALTPAPGAGEVVFDDVWFAHGEQPVLRGVSFRLEAGQTLGILGPSGSGKSTIAQLLLRLYDPDSGSILLGGRPLSDLPRKEVRGQVAAVLQEPFLFTRSLRDNVRLGRPEASDAEVEEAARQASVHGSIAAFERGYETVVGERGVTLSGGQRQRTALARALLQRPAVLLLDDALSAVDTGTEAAILSALERQVRRRPGQSTVVIAHRVSTVRDADLILVLDSGRVVQQGNHDRLVALEGPYRRLWEAQNALAEPAALVEPSGPGERASPHRETNSPTAAKRPERSGRLTPVA